MYNVTTINTAPPTFARDPQGFRSRLLGLNNFFFRRSSLRTDSHLWSVRQRLHFVSSTAFHLIFFCDETVVKFSFSCQLIFVRAHTSLKRPERPHTFCHDIYFPTTRSIRVINCCSKYHFKLALELGTRKSVFGLGCTSAPCSTPLAPSAR
jgi:hypothetical protein